MKKKEKYTLRTQQAYLKVINLVICPKCLTELKPNNARPILICQRNPLHQFPIINGIPTFVVEGEIPQQDALFVSWYDKKIKDGKINEYDEEYFKKYNELLGTDLRKEFLKVFEKFPVSPSCRILDHSTGTGGVIFGIRQIYPNVACEFVGSDLSMGVLNVAKRKFLNAGMEVPLFHTKNEELPFKNDSFDIVTHVGGINSFQDIRATLEECVRVLKPEGILVVVDEGLSPAVRKTQQGGEIIKDNGLFGLHPPIEYLPPLVKNIELSWIARDTFYVILCRKLGGKELKDVKPLPYEISTRLSFYSKRCYPHL